MRPRLLVVAAGDRLRLTADVTRRAAREHRAPRSRVLLRAALLRALGGFGPAESLALGALDPATPLRGVRRDLASKRAVERAQARLNPAGVVPLTEDKRLFARVAAAGGVPTPRLIAVTGGDPADGPASAADLGRWAAVLAADPASGMVVKPADGYHGRDVLVVRRDGAGWAEVTGARRWDSAGLLALALARGSPQIVQERLRNAPALQDANPSEALQTVRVMTLLRSGSPVILGASLRLAAAAAATDNWAGNPTGTVLAEIDPAGGTVRALHTAREHQPGLHRVDRHPGTGRVLVGWTVPQWAEVADLARRAAEVFRPLVTVGWDIAITPDGPVLVEGNAEWDPPPFAGSGAHLRALRRAARAR